MPGPSASAVAGFGAPRIGPISVYDASPDFTIIYKNSRKFVHKSMLERRSGFFRSIFRSGWKEQHENVANFEEFDCEDWMFDELIGSLYTGQFDFDRMSAGTDCLAPIIDICIIADYLQAPLLVQQAEDELKTTCNAYITNLARVRYTGDDANDVEKFKWAPYYTNLVPDVRAEFTAAIRRLYAHGAPGVSVLPGCARILFRFLKIAGSRFFTNQHVLSLGVEVHGFQHAALATTLATPLTPRLMNQTNDIMARLCKQRKPLPRGWAICSGQHTGSRAACDHKIISKMDPKLGKTFIVHLEHQGWVWWPRKHCEVCVKFDDIPKWIG